MLRKRGAERHGPISKKKGDQSSWTRRLSKGVRLEDEGEAKLRKIDATLHPLEVGLKDKE